MTDCYGSITPEVETYFKNFSYTIGQLANISTLDLSGTNLFYAKNLGNGLNETQRLTSINLDRCWSGPAASQWEGGTELFEGLKSHSNLTSLSASLNPIGVDSFGNADPNSTLALANALKSWPQLRDFVLPYTYIGYNDTNSLDIFLQELGKLATTIKKPGKYLKVNFLNGIHNSTWSKEIDTFRKLMNQSVIDNCALELCTGKLFSQCQNKENKERVIEHSKLPKEAKKEPVISSESHTLPSYKELLTSSSSRLTPFYQPLVNALKPWFSMKAWSTWGDNALDSVVNAIQNYSRDVVENAPGYFSDNFPSDSELELYNYPSPHFRARNTTLMLDGQVFEPRENITNMILLQSPQFLTLPTNSQPIGLLSK